MPVKIDLTHQQYTLQDFLNFCLKEEGDQFKLIYYF